MWFVLSLITVLIWGFGDLFTKIGSNEDDKYSHWKIVFFVGTVMGLHATVTLLLGAKFNPMDFIRYSPAIVCYVSSMILGYVGLRYILLSVSSPICNSSGAIAGALCLAFLKQVPDGVSTVGIVLVTIGVTGLAFAEERTSDITNVDGQKYKKGFVAVFFPIFYCILDGLGTFADAVILDSGKINEESANIAYEYTFFIMAVFSFVYVYIIHKEKFCFKKELPKLATGICETAGQFSYIYAIGSNPTVVAPMVSSYCVVSVVLSRIILKERLNTKQKITVLIVLLGILLMGIAEGLGN